MQVYIQLRTSIINESTREILFSRRLTLTQHGSCYSVRRATNHAATSCSCPTWFQSHCWMIPLFVLHFSKFCDDLLSLLGGGRFFNNPCAPKPNVRPWNIHHGFVFLFATLQFAQSFDGFASPFPGRLLFGHVVGRWRQSIHGSFHGPHPTTGELMMSVREYKSKG